MDLRSQLPKIGTEIDGEVFLDDGETWCGSRPDYEQIKTGYATESECIGALLGIGPSFDLIESILLTQKCEGATVEKYFDLLTFCGKLKTSTDIGIAEGKIRVVLEYENSQKQDWLPSHSRILDTKSFFSWMHEQGYPVPDELDYFLKGSLPVDYSCLTDEQQREYVSIWKKKGPKQKTNKEIMLALWPEESKEIVRFNDKDPVFAKLRGRIRIREGKR